MLNFKDMSVKDKVLLTVNAAASARQELIMQLRASQAKVVQELAIAQRINTAETVEIEEVYEASGKEGLNVQTSDAGVSGGLSGEGSRATKRIYRFIGWHEGAAQVLDKQHQQEE